MSVDDLQIYWFKSVYCHQAMVNLISQQPHQIMMIMITLYLAFLWARPRAMRRSEAKSVFDPV